MRLTSSVLKRLVKEELSKLNETKKSKNASDVGEKKSREVYAGDFADSLEKKFDFAKALGLEEMRLRRRLRRVHEQRKRVLKHLSSL